MKGTITALLIGMTGMAHAGQTGSFDEIAHRSWACATEAAMAEVMAQKSPDAMRSTAERERCVMLEPGTRLWAHGGNALIAFGGLEGADSVLYYPVAAVGE